MPSKSTRSHRQTKPTTRLSHAALSALTLAIAAVALPTTGLFSASPAMAQEAQADNAQERINYSGRLRMLSQMIPAAACMQVAGVETGTATTMLQDASTEFGNILDALENGNSEMGIEAAETRRMTLAALEKVRGLWVPFSEASDAVVAGQDAEANLQSLRDLSPELLLAAQELSGEISSQYSSPGSLLQADAFVIDMAGRQRMLLQEISKDVCLINTGRGRAEEREELQKTMDVFINTLNALRLGMPAAGIQAPPTAEIGESLDAIFNDWQTMQPQFVALLGGETLSDADAGEKFMKLNSLMVQMNSVVQMYSDQTKRDS